MCEQRFSWRVFSFVLLLFPCFHSFRLASSDNPLTCSCDLIWFPELLQSLKDRDDEMTQKKRPMCYMQNEHREYFVQSMPLGRMSCVGKRLVNSQLNSGAAPTKRIMLLFSFISMISLYFWGELMRTMSSEWKRVGGWKAKKKKERGENIHFKINIYIKKPTWMNDGRHSAPHTHKNANFYWLNDYWPIIVDWNGAVNIMNQDGGKFSQNLDSHLFIFSRKSSERMKMSKKWSKSFFFKFFIRFLDIGITHHISQLGLMCWKMLNSIWFSFPLRRPFSSSNFSFSKRNSAFSGSCFWLIVHNSTADNYLQSTFCTQITDKID